MRVEITELQWVEDHVLSEQELLERSGLSAAVLAELVHGGSIAPLDAGAPRRFSAEALRTARRAGRLQRDFELDAHALALALGLIERVQDLEAQLRALRARLVG